MTRLPGVLSIIFGLSCAPVQADGLAYKRILIGKIGVDRSIDDFDAHLRAEFQSMDADEDGGLTHKDLAKALNLQMAEARARYMVSWLRNDVDGDFNITADELRQSVRFRSLSRGGRGALPPPDEVAADIADAVAKRLEIDTDGDGTISLNELSQAAKTQAMKIVANKRSQLLPGHELDLNCDDKITEAEFVSVFRDVFEIADQDGDGTISRIEFTAGLSRAVMDDFAPSGALDCDAEQK